MNNNDKLFVKKLEKEINVDKPEEPVIESQDNLRAAMAAVIRDESDMSISPFQNPDGGPADKQVLIRTTQYERDRWKDAAALDRKNLSSWIREHLNNQANLSLDCQHPMNETKFYPWATICMKCNTRLWQNGQ